MVANHLGGIMSSAVSGLTQFNSRAQFFPSLSVAAASVTGSYTAIGSELGHNACILIITSTLNQPVWVSFDGVNDNIITLGTAFQNAKVIDLKANGLILPGSTIIYVKAVSTLPASGSLYFEFVGA